MDLRSLSQAGTAYFPAHSSTQSIAPRTNAEGLKLIKTFEGLKLETHICASGVLEIGYGSRVGVQLGQRITLEEAEALLLRDLQPFEAAIAKMVPVPLSSNQFSALVCFAFDVGVRALQTSTLLKHLRNGDYQTAADQLLGWDRVDGQTHPHLQRRRQAERALFLKP